MLILAFPYTTQTAGSAWCYTLTPELAEQWEFLTRRHAGEDRTLPYHDLSAALKFVTRDFAAVRRGPDGASTLVLTRKPPRADHLAMLFSGFEEALARRHNLTFHNRLAPLLDGVTPCEVLFGDYLSITGPTGEPDPPGWVYDAATWHAAELLTSQPMRLSGGRSIALRADSDGNLLAWQDLLPGTKEGTNREQAMHYLSLEAVTMPGFPGLVLSLDAHVSRLTSFFGNARTVWIAADDDRLILSAGFRYDTKAKRRDLRGTIAELTDSFTLRGVPELHDDILRREPSRVRARYHSTPADHPVGSGPGRKFLDLALAHAIACLPAGSEPLELIDSKIRGIDRPATRKKGSATPHDRHSLTETLTSSETRLHLTVVYATDALRARAVRALSKILDSEVSALGTPDSTVVITPERLKVTFRYAAKGDLLTPGDPSPRERTAHAVSDSVEPGWLGAVFAETSAREAHANGAKPKDDPKRQGRRAHAKHGIVSQHLDMASAPKNTSAEDHPANTALLDLLRSAGLTGTHPAGVFNRPLTPQHVVLVGIHSRIQIAGKGRMITLAAVVADGTDTAWECLAYHPGVGGWRPYPEALAAYHAAELTPFGKELSYEARTSQAAKYAQRALNQILIRYPGLPVVLFADGVGCRTLWPGLTNKKLGIRDEGSLPHIGLANADDGQVALVRVITSDDGEVPRPARAGELGPSVDEFVSASTKLYQLATSKAAAYYLVNRSRMDQAYDWAVREGHRKTRFDIADNPSVLSAAWHGMTCTEFTVIDKGSWTDDQLGALGARMCGHPLAWDGRTSRPIPLHLARQMVEDHPDRT
jgi:hypothetical protein